MISKILWLLTVLIGFLASTSVLANTVVIYLVGLAGTGKYTIAKEIASQYEYKLVDNHLLNNPIFSLLPKGAALNPPEGTTDKIQRIREVVFEFITEDKHSNYVFTNQLLEKAYHHEIYENVLQLATKRNSIFIPVQLVISKAERAKRIVQADRVERFKITDIKEAHRPKNAIQLKHKHLLTLDVTYLRPEEAVNKIMAHRQALENSYEK